jgi:hypothetical protein
MDHQVSHPTTKTKGGMPLKNIEGATFIQWVVWSNDICKHLKTKVGNAVSELFKKYSIGVLHCNQ